MEDSGLPEGDWKSRLHFKAPEGGTGVVVSPENSASTSLELEIVRLPPGGQEAGAGLGKETLLVVLGGRIDVDLNGARWDELGRRPNVFGGRATSVYIPPGTPYQLRSTKGAEVALFRAPAPPGGAPYVIGPDDVDVATRGRIGFEREVHTILDARRPAAALVVGETFNVPGAWSSYPPHKHDVHDPPRESRLQEVYHFRMDPPQGFGIQRIYSRERDLDEVLVVEDRDTVVIPYGYHPVVAAPGYRLYYLWALAGEGRDLHVFEDPAHSWVVSVEKGASRSMSG
jgi:5-deoxy-glucuronate isomerase